MYKIKRSTTVDHRDGRTPRPGPRRRIARLAFAVAAALVLIVPSAASPAHADVWESIPGGSAFVQPGYARICAVSGWTITFWYAHSVVPGQEVGGNTSVRSGCKNVYPPVSGSKFRHFHLCNQQGHCGREVYV